MAQAWTQEIAALEVIPEQSSASVANMLAIQADLVALALVQSDIAAFAYAETEMFAGQSHAGRGLGVAMLYPETVQIVTLRRSGIVSVGDLAGRSVAISPAGSGTAVNARQILDAHGLGEDQVKLRNLTFKDSAEAIRNGIVDAAFMTAGVPTGAVRDLSRIYGDNLVLVPIAEEMVVSMVERWPHYQPAVIEAARYRGLEDDIATVAVHAILDANAAIDAALVTEMLEVLYDEDTLAHLCRRHPVGCTIDRSAAVADKPLPLHPGSRTYFERVAPAETAEMVPGSVPEDS
jgi:uncharacterized protein